MQARLPTKKAPSTAQNIKLKEKSEVFSEVTHASQRSYQFQAAPLVKHLNLDIFKVTPCNIPTNHDHKHCINYHNSKDRKRYGNFYGTDMCPYVKAEQKCPEGERCMYAHSFVEEHYHYLKYKKQFCSHYPVSVGECPYGDFCSYAHNEEEILTPLIHNYAENEDFYMFLYKTEFCPFNLTEHDKSKCVYAHNWQDYRRKPDHYSYEPIACFHWKTKEYIHDYNSGCEIGQRCNMCHGWKEQQYHPSHYKTLKCDLQGCKKGSCPNYHSQKEKRVVDPQVISHAFRYVRKNRIVEGVFKSNMKKEGFKLKPEHKSRTFMQPRLPEPEETEFKAKTLVSVKERPETKEVESNKWIQNKQLIDSEEDSDEFDNQIVASQVFKLNLDE